MKKINIRDIPEDSWISPKGKFAAFGKSVSIALGRSETPTGLLATTSPSGGGQDRHPFDLEILRVAPGQTPYVYHSHSAQWELYHVISGKGSVRHQDGTTAIEAGDAFLFKPGEPHQLTNNGDVDLVVFVIADNPIGESSYYPDSNKWIVRSPERRIMRSDPLDYFDGEE
ncbi:MAG: cupin domain-containing protein [Spartobacteria bacterium]